MSALAAVSVCSTAAAGDVWLRWDGLGMRELTVRAGVEVGQRGDSVLAIGCTRLQAGWGRDLSPVRGGGSLGVLVWEMRSLEGHSLPLTLLP